MKKTDGLEDVVDDILDNAEVDVEGAYNDYFKLKKDLASAIRTYISGVIDKEPELPGDMPDDMWDAIKDDRDACQKAMQIIVRQTKDNIKQALRLGE